MKKSVKILLSLLCLCPIVMLTACGDSTYYVINVSSSDDTIGTFSNNRSNNPRQLEGTSITLTAIEKNLDENPFICWVKDNNTVVSTESQLQMTYSSQTAGNYTAVFEESPSGMMYTAVDYLNINNSSYNGASFTLYYSNRGSDIYVELESGSFSSEGEYLSSHMAVLYLGGAGTMANYQYNFKIDITLAEETISLESQAILSNNSFNGTSTTLINFNNDNIEISMSLEKLNNSLYSVV